MKAPVKFLFICTHNRCRSILSEAIMNHHSDGAVVARSAGSQPAGEVHPLSLKYLAETCISTEGLQSQSWDAFASWHPDVVITVCDAAANEPCPLWLSEGIKLHWGLRDPSKVEGSDADIATAFRETIEEITRRTREILALPFADLDTAGLQRALAGLGAHTSDSH